MRSNIVWEDLVPRNETRVIRLLIALCFPTCLLIPGIAAPQTLAPLSISDVLNGYSFGEVSPLSISPDGRWVAYMVRDKKKVAVTKSETERFVRTGIFSRNESGEIWITDAQTGITRNLTGGGGSNWQPTWSPNGRYLAFLSDRDGSGQAKLWFWDLTKDQLRLAKNSATRAAYSSNEIVWTHDSRKVLITVVPEGFSVEAYVKQVLSPQADQQLPSSATPGSTVTVYQADSVDSSGSTTSSSPMGNLDAAALHDLVLIEAASGRTEAIVRGHRIEGYSLSPDGMYIAYAEPKRYYKPGSYRRVFDLRSVNLATREEHLLASDIILNDDFSWSPDGSLVTYAAYGGDDKSYEFYVAPPGGGPARQVATVPHETLDGLWLSPVWGRDSEYFYFILDGILLRGSVAGGEPVALTRIPEHRITHTICRSHGHLWTMENGKSTVLITRDDDGKQDGFYKVDLVTGKSLKLREEGKCYQCKWSSYITAVSEDGLHLVYVSEDAQHAPDIWTTDPTFLSARQLTHLNPQFEKYKMGSARVVDWLSDDGDRLRGALLLPSDYQEGKRYPLLVWVYPGIAASHAVDEFGFGGENLGPLNMQLFATRGYAVLFPDTTERVGERFAGLVKSVLPGVSKVVEMGIADPERVGVMGHSQGGFATLALLVQTSRFKVAMAADGWGDSTAYYGILSEDGTAYQYGQAEWQLGATPWQRPTTYIQNSPMYYLDRVTAPLLLVHGSEDDSHPSFLADEIFVGLRRLGKRVDYAKYMNEGHAPADWSYANQVDLANRVLSWFNRYLSRVEY